MRGSDRLARGIGWLLPLATLASYVWLAVVLGGRLGAESGGALPFDLRLAGYDLTEARAYLRALSPEGVALYLGPIGRADTLFPVLMGLCLLWWMRPLQGGFGMVCMVTATAYVGLDLGENLMVARMLQAGPDWVTLTEVTQASALTQAKFATVALAALLAARQIWRRRRG